MKKSTGYNHAPQLLRTDLLESLRGIDVKQTLNQIKSEIDELDAFSTQLTKEQYDLWVLRLRQSWILYDHLIGVRTDMSEKATSEFIQSLPYLPQDMEGAAGSISPQERPSTTTSTTDASTSQFVDLGVDQDSSESDMEVEHLSQESRTKRKRSGP